MGRIAGVFCVAAVLLLSREPEAQPEPASQPTQEAIPEVTPPPTIVAALFYVLRDPTFAGEVAEAPAPLAVPIACRAADGSWVPRRLTCLMALSEGLAVVGTPADGASALWEIAADGFYEHAGRVLRPTPERAQFVWLGGAAAPRAACRVEDAEPIAPSEESIAGVPLLAREEAAELRQAIVSGELRSDDRLIADLDGDGGDDILDSLAWWGDGEPCYTASLIVARWSGRPDQPQLIELTCDGPDLDPSLTTSSRYGQAYFHASHCFDLDDDPAVELVLANGGETERSYSVVEWDGARLVDIGMPIGLGD